MDSAQLGFTKKKKKKKKNLHVYVFLFKVVHSKFQDLVPKQIDDDDPSFERPDEEAIQDQTEKTRQALEKLVSSKISAAMPVKAAEKQAPVQYIRYSVISL